MQDVRILALKKLIMTRVIGKLDLTVTRVIDIKDEGYWHSDEGYCMNSRN
jgi:hypothetical protein